MKTDELSSIGQSEPAMIDSVLKQHAGEKGSLLPILHDVQHAVGYIHPDAVRAIAEALNLSRAEVHGVISYYHDFHTAPQPPHRISVCRAEACQTRGGQALLEHARRELRCDDEHVSEDGLFKVSAAYCLGLCASSPAVMLDDDVHARVSPKSFDNLVALVRSAQ